MDIDLPHPFAVSVASDGFTTLLRLHGELDIAAEREIAAEIDEVLAARPSTLTVDLRQLVFLDSTGLRALLRLRESCSSLGCELVLVRGTPVVQRVFDVSGVSAHFAMADDVPALQQAV